MPTCIWISIHTFSLYEFQVKTKTIYSQEYNQECEGTEWKMEALSV